MIRIPESIVKFSNGETDVYKKFGDYFNHYKAVTYGAKVDYDNSVSFEEKGDKLHKAIELEISKVAGVNNTMFSDAVWRTNPQYRWGAFAVIGGMIDMIIPDTIASDFYQFAQVKSVGFGDTLSFDVPTGDLFTITKAGNGKRHAFAQRQYNATQVLNPENHMITVEEDLYRVLAGKRNLAEYAMKAAIAIETEITVDIYTAIADTYSSLAANFKETSFTQNGFIKLCQRVQAANKNSKVIVYGTKLALSQILPTNDYLKMQIGSEYVKVGYLRNFLGADIIEIPQKIDWAGGTYDFALAEDKLYFISAGVNSIVKIGFEGETLTITDNQYANATLAQTTTMHKRWATGVITSAKYGIMDVIA